jgi:hypothetical protein
VQADDVACWVVQDEADKIKGNDRPQPDRKVVEERLEVVVLRDRFADLEQSLELPPLLFGRSSERRIER